MKENKTKHLSIHTHTHAKKVFRVKLTVKVKSHAPFYLFLNDINFLKLKFTSVLYTNTHYHSK